MGTRDDLALGHQEGPHQGRGVQVGQHRGGLRGSENVSPGIEAERLAVKPHQVGHSVGRDRHFESAKPVDHPAIGRERPERRIEAARVNRQLGQQLGVGQSHDPARGV